MKKKIETGNLLPAWQPAEDARKIINCCKNSIATGNVILSCKAQLLTMVWSSSYMMAVTTGNGWRVSYSLPRLSKIMRICILQLHLMALSVLSASAKCRQGGCGSNAVELRISLLFLLCYCEMLNLALMLWVQVQMKKKEGRFKWNNTALTITYRKTKNQVVTTPMRAIDMLGSFHHECRNCPEATGS